MKINEIPKNQMVSDALIERYRDKIRTFTFSDSKLKIKHSLDLNKLKLNIDQIMEKYGRHPWKTAEGGNLIYSGFSINYNPDHQDSIDPNASSLGTPKNKPGEF